MATSVQTAATPSSVPAKKKERTRRSAPIADHTIKLVVEVSVGKSGKQVIVHYTDGRRPETRHVADGAYYGCPQMTIQQYREQHGKRARNARGRALKFQF